MRADQIDERTRLTNPITRLFTMLLLSIALAAPAGAAPQLTTLYNFSIGNGEYPRTGLVQGSDGNLYGTTGKGGSNDTGTVFKLSPAGVLTTLVNFTEATGFYPDARLVEDASGNLYGTTTDGDTGSGTVFKVTPSGILTTLVILNGTPEGGLIQDTDGNFYGTTVTGYGTVFKLSPPSAGATAWNITILHSFDGTDGFYPGDALVQDSQGNLYGTTRSGGNSFNRPNQEYGNGTVFKISASGAFSSLYSFPPSPNGFSYPDGFDPNAGLIQDSHGNLYGTTVYGGSGAMVDAYSGYGGGTAFKLSPPSAGATAWTNTVLHSFDGTDGLYPGDALVQDSQGNLYGTTIYGGSSYVSPFSTQGDGTVFSLSLAGVLSTLVNFTGTNGANPYAGVARGTDGNLYGTTTDGGNTYMPGQNAGYGTVFEIALANTVSPTTLISLSPATLQAGNLAFVLTVTGTGFAPGVTANFNGTVLTPASITSTKLTLNIPAVFLETPGTFSVAVDNPGTNPSNSLTFTLIPRLTLTSVSPASAPAGSQPISITVTGTNFVNGAIVKWNGLLLPTFYLSPTQATATVPASYLATASTAKITISNPHVYATPPLTFTVTVH